MHKWRVSRSKAEHLIKSSGLEKRVKFTPYFVEHMNADLYADWVMENVIIGKRRLTDLRVERANLLCSVEALKKSVKAEQAEMVSDVSVELQSYFANLLLRLYNLFTQNYMWTCNSESSVITYTNVVSVLRKHGFAVTKSGEISIKFMRSTCKFKMLVKTCQRLRVLNNILES